jgi:RNAse (barnase) inhibitor barstar
MADEKIEEKIEEAQQTAADALEGVSDVATDLDDHTEEDEALWEALKNEILEPLILELENLKLEISTIRTELAATELKIEEPEKPKEEPEKPKGEPEPEPALPIEPVETIVEEKPVEKPKQRIRFL